MIGFETGLAYVDRRFAFPKRRRLLEIAAGLSLVLLAAVVFGHSVPEYATLDGTLALPFALIIIWFAENDARRVVLRWPPLVFLGEASYSIYILQEVVIVGVIHFDRKFRWPIPAEDVVSLLIYLSVLALASIGSYRLFEVPARRLLRAWLEPAGSPESRTVASGLLPDLGPGVANEPTRDA